MAELTLRVVFSLIYVLLGASHIGFAIRDYKKGRYFAGGFSSMLVLWVIFQLAKIVFMEEI